MIALPMNYTSFGEHSQNSTSKDKLLDLVVAVYKLFIKLTTIDVACVEPKYKHGMLTISAPQFYSID